MPTEILVREAGTADDDGVGRFGVVVVGDELADGLGFAVEQVDEDDTIGELNALADEFHRGDVTIQERLYAPLDEGLGEDIGEGHLGEGGNDAGDEAGVVGVLDDHGEFEGGFFHLDRGLRAFEAGAIDDVGPVEEFAEAGGIEVELVAADGGDEAGAGDVVGVEEVAEGLRAVLAGLEVSAVVGGHEGALVVIEPPGEPGGA